MNRPGPLVLLVLLVLLAALLGASCSHAPPQWGQVFDQVNRVWDPATQTWSARLAVFVQASSPDGNRVFDRLHLIHDGEGLFFTLASGTWSAVDRTGEFWVGSSSLTFPDGRVPTGPWRAVLVTKTGQRLEGPFTVPPQPPTAPPARTAPVALNPVAGVPLKYRVEGWVDDYLVWARDAQGTVLARQKTVGPEFTVSAGIASVVLYSYDKDRGEGLEAGPFPIQVAVPSADR